MAVLPYCMCSFSAHVYMSALQVISIQYLHASSVIYCDLKPSNILLDENGRIKLGGFGLSRRLSDINKTPLQQLPSVGAIGIKG